MARARKTVPGNPQPTAEVTRTIVAFIRAGSFPGVAAEAAGISGEIFADWMRRGTPRDAPARYRTFRNAIRRAQAEARVTVEVELRQSKPLDWLRSGPGKPGDLGDGWTTPVKVGTARPALEDIDLLALTQTQELITCVLNILRPHPDLREAVARALDHLSSPVSQPGA